MTWGLLNMSFLSIQRFPSNGPFDFMTRKDGLLQGHVQFLVIAVVVPCILRV